MKKILTLALAAVISVPMALLATAQDDIYFSKSKASKKALYAETSADVWETDANSDWDVDTYNRRGPAPSEKIDSTYSGSYRANIGKDTQKIVMEENGVVRDTVVQLVEVRVYDDPYYWSSRIWRFHNPVFHMHLFDPIFDFAFYDPWYDPWYYGGGWSWTWGWHWTWGWYDPFYTGYYGGYYHAFFSGYHHGLLASGVIHHHNNGGHFTHRPNRLNGPGRELASNRPGYTRNRALDGGTRGGYTSNRDFSLRGGNTRTNAVDRTSGTTRSGSNRSGYNNRGTSSTRNTEGTVNRGSTSRNGSSNRGYTSNSSSRSTGSYNSSRSTSSSSTSRSSSSTSSFGGSRSGGSFGGGSHSSGVSHSSGGSRGGGGRR